MKKQILTPAFLALALFFSLTTSLFAQQQPAMGEHMAQKLEFARKVKSLSKRFDINGQGIRPLHVNKTKALSKIVFGFMPDWEYTNGANNDMHYELLSHVAVFDFFASSNGSLEYPDAWPWDDVINAAHDKGTKVIMAVTNFNSNSSEKPADIAHHIMTDLNAKNILFNNIKNVITTYHLDGVNIDFEALASADRGNLLNQFMHDLTAFIHSELPGKEVSFDGPAVNWSGWNIDGLAQSVDYIFIMAYDYSGSWSTNTGPVSPLTGPAGTHYIEYDLTHTYGAPLTKYPQKLILGVPYYGKHWTTVSGSPGAATTGFVGSTFYRNVVSDAASHGGFIWDVSSQTPWYKWQSGSWNQVWNDNERSLGEKYDFALTENIGGVGIWALNYDGTRSELWNLISSKFTGSVTPIPGVPQSPAVLLKNDTSVTLKFKPGNFADSYRIYQSIDNSTYAQVKETTDTVCDISGLTPGTVYYFKIAAVNDAGESIRTHVLAALPGNNHPKILIVDGVERRSFPAIIQYRYPMTQLGYTFSSASNEAVTNNIVNLENYDFIIWMLLDESTADDTFNKDEQAKVKAFINQGKGAFIVSGSEVGWDLVEKGDAVDKNFYQTYFKARYIKDAPGTGYVKFTAEDNNNEIYHFDDGNQGMLAKGIRYPDLIKPLNGSTESFTYPGVDTASGIAGVSYQTATGGLEYLAFPIESVYSDAERKDLLQYIFNTFSYVSVPENPIQNRLRLYPNPTHGQLTITGPRDISVRQVEVFDVYGRKCQVELHAQNIDISRLPIGIYVVRVEDSKGNHAVFKVIKR
jgi:spore germination protein YaaH